MIDIEQAAVKSAQEPAHEKQEKDLADTENIFARSDAIGDGWGTH